MATVCLSRNGKGNSWPLIGIIALKRYFDNITTFLLCYVFAGNICHTPQDITKSFLKICSCFITKTDARVNTTEKPFDRQLLHTDGLVM